MLSFPDARRKVIEVVTAISRERRKPSTEHVALDASLGRVLAASVNADRDYPPFNRSTRDGYAVRAADLREPGATLQLVGEIAAGQAFSRALQLGECVQIMTGAAPPEGADAVEMIEYTRPEENSNAGSNAPLGRVASPGRVHFDRTAKVGQNIVPRGSEARAGQTLLRAGARLGYVELSLAAQVGCVRPELWARPRVGILSTGDEVINATETPGPLQIRNGNSFSLAAQVESAGAEAVLLGNAPDEAAELKRRIAEGLKLDALVLSGGVSAGKYDLVEGVLAELGAEIYFDGVAIRPGRPAVFAKCAGKPVFGLPGNPVSTMVTFELFVLPALDILSGAEARPLPLLRAKLGAQLHEKPALAHFLPARIEWTSGEPVVTAVRWQGSGDVVALADTNCFLVVHESKLDWEVGDWIDVMPRRGAL
jgi:molybdopterin molybdotransferase